MKKILALVALVAVSFSSFAATPFSASVAGPVTNTSTVDTKSAADASNQGNSQNITFSSPEKTTVDQTVNQTVNGTTTSNQVVSGGTNSSIHQTFGTQTIKNTPSVSGPPLTASNDTCMGSASGSANGPGFGISLGKTYTDDNCVMLKNSRELWNMGMKAASMALMCMDKNNRAALEMTGFTCPQSQQRQAAAKAGEPTDPYVRARLGLPAIQE